MPTSTGEELRLFLKCTVIGRGVFGRCACCGTGYLWYHVLSGGGYLWHQVPSVKVSPEVGGYV